MPAVTLAWLCHHRAIKGEAREAVSLKLPALFAGRSNAESLLPQQWFAVYVTYGHTLGSFMTF